MKQKLVLAVVLVIAIASVVYLMMSNDSKAAAFEIADGNLKIAGSFGVTVPLNGMTGLEMKSALPEIGRKTNGSGLGSVYKGEFTFTDGTKARLYVDAKKPPFVSFRQGEVVFYVNLETAEKTQELYDNLAKAVKP